MLLYSAYEGLQNTLVWTLDSYAYASVSESCFGNIDL
jgi:hypothetical protein